MYWQADHNAKRKPGRPRKNWIDTIRQDLKSIGMTWEDAEQSAINREDWCQSVAQCVYDTGWPKSKYVRSSKVYTTVSVTHVANKHD